jgi:hypothetical protein
MEQLQRLFYFFLKRVATVAQAYAVPLPKETPLQQVKSKRTYCKQHWDSKQQQHQQLLHVRCSALQKNHDATKKVKSKHLPCITNRRRPFAKAAL